MCVCDVIYPSIYLSIDLSTIALISSTLAAGFLEAAKAILPLQPERPIRPRHGPIFFYQFEPT